MRRALHPPKAPRSKSRRRRRICRRARRSATGDRPGAGAAAAGASRRSRQNRRKAAKVQPNNAKASPPDRQHRAPSPPAIRQQTPRLPAMGRAPSSFVAGDGDDARLGTPAPLPLMRRAGSRTARRRRIVRPRRGAPRRVTAAGRRAPGKRLSTRRSPQQKAPMATALPRIELCQDGGRGFACFMCAEALTTSLRMGLREHRVRGRAATATPVMPVRQLWRGATESRAIAAPPAPSGRTEWRATGAAVANAAGGPRVRGTGSGAVAGTSRGGGRK